MTPSYRRQGTQVTQATDLRPGWKMAEKETPVAVGILPMTISTQKNLMMVVL